MKRFVIALLCTLLITSVALSAGDSAVTVLKAARLFDGQGDLPIPDAVVIVEGNRIAQVGRNLPIPTGARVIELGAATLLPGYIDCHTHLLTNLDPTLGSEDDALLLTVVEMSTAKRALLGAKMAREDLFAGITAVRDVGNSGLNGDVALRDAIEQGWVEGPRIVASTRALSGPGGQFGILNSAAKAIVSQEYATINSPEDARRAVQEAVADGADLIKVIVGGYAVINSDEIKAIVEEAHRQHRKVAAHANGDDATRMAAQASVDSIEHAYTVPDDVLKLMAARHIFLVPTDSVADTYREFISQMRDPTSKDHMEEIVSSEIERRVDRLKRAVSFGVPLAAGSDEYYQLGKKTRGESSVLMLQAYLNAGMTPTQVIKMATSNAAELLGWQDRIGIVKKGNLADIIAVPGDPSARPSQLLNVQFVMKEGRVIRNDLKNE